MCSLLKNKYNNLCPDLFVEDKCAHIEELDENYILPSSYRISTMTLISCFTCNINLEVVSKYFYHC